MKPFKCLFVSLFFLLSASPVIYGQEWLMAIKQAERSLARSRHQYKGKVDHALEKNIARAKTVALSANKRTGVPNVFPSIYPVSEEELMKYFFSLTKGWMMEENKQFITQQLLFSNRQRKLIERRKEWEPFLQERKPMNAEELAQLIPADKKYVFMGEYHKRELTLHLQNTIIAYARLHPDKKIFVFTEFAQENIFSFAENPFLLEVYTAVFNEEKIPWVGLEESAPLRLCAVQDPLGCLQGMKARNTHWIQILKSYREKYPDAVFFIHAGGAHVEYTAPYSLPQAFQRKECFVIDFVPMGLQKEPFHVATRHDFYREGTLIFNHPRYSTWAGFDVQSIWK